MKKFLTSIALAFTLSTAYAATSMPFQGGTGTNCKPTLGQILLGNSSGVYDCVATSSLGITGGSGISNEYASTTFASLLYGSSTYATQASLGLYVPYGYGTTTYYMASNPSGFITSSSLTPYMTLAYGTSTYIPLASSSLFYLASNPSGYITSSSLTPYMTLAYATGTYMPLASSSLFYLATNPSGYITNSVSTLTNYPTYTYATDTLATKANPTFTGTTTHPNIRLTGWLRDSINASGTVGQCFTSTGTSSLWGSCGGGSYTGTYPIIVSGSVISTGFSTSTTNVFTGTTTLATTTFLGPVKDSTGSVGSSGQVLSSNGTSSIWITNAAGGLSGSGTNGKVTRFSGASTVTDGALLDNGTVAGINATTSTASVNIQGGSGLLPLRVASSTGGMLIEVGVNGSLVFATTTATSTGSNDGMAVQSKSFAQFNTLTVKNPLDRIETPLQSALWNKNVVWRTPGIVAAGLCENTVCTNLGSAALVLPTVSNAYTAMRRTTFATVVTTNNQQVGVRTAAEFFRGTNQVNGPHLGGFFFAAKIGFTTWTNNDRLFVGLSSCTTACLTSTTTLTNLANTVGFGIEGNASANNIVFLTNDASGVISTTTIPGLPALANNQAYDMYIYAPANRHEIHWRIDNASTSAIIATGTVTTNLPATTTLLLGHAAMSNGLNTTVGAATLGVGKIYIESER